MEMFRMSFIGHRRLYSIRSIEERIERIVRDVLSKKEYVEFYIGRNGDFDILAASVIKSVRNDIGTHNSSMILVLPYHSKDERYYEEYYDDIYLPIDGKTHFKAAITKRNEWLVDNSDLLVAYVNTQSGGAYNTLRYAEKKGIEIINIANDI